MGLELLWIGRIPVPYKPNFTGFTRKTPEAPQRKTCITLLLRYCGYVLKALPNMITLPLKCTVPIALLCQSVKLKILPLPIN